MWLAPPRRAFQVLEDSQSHLPLIIPQALRDGLLHSPGGLSPLTHPCCPAPPQRSFQATVQGHQFSLTAVPENRIVL